MTATAVTITKPAVAPVAGAAGGPNPELVHQVCCDDNRALCGTDVSSLAWADDNEDLTCLVCIDLLDGGVLCRRGCCREADAC